MLECLLTAVELHYPIGFPGRTAVARKRLLPGRAPSRVGFPGKADSDGPAVQSVIRKEKANVTGETANDRYVEVVRSASVKPPDCPSLCLQIERAERDCPYVALRKTKNVVLNIAHPTENLSRGGRSRKLGPIGAAAEARLQSTVLDPPVSDNEVEISRDLELD